MRRRLIFLPGAGGDPGFWKPVGERLPADWEKIYLGWPGLGEQRPDPSIRNFGDLVGLVEACLGDAPVDLLAQSLGGVVASQVALKHPTQVRRLVLAATSGGVDVAGLGGADWRPVYRREFPEAAPWIMDPVPDISGELGKVRRPTLLLWGDADPISPVAVGKKLLELLPKAHLHVVPGGDHGFVHAHPEAVLAMITEHLA